MKTKIYYSTVAFCLIIGSSAFGQSVTRSVNSSIQGATCPGIGIDYDVSVPSGFENCQISWSASNGTAVKNPSNQTKASVTWQDIPGAIGTVTATFSNCTGHEGNNGTMASLSETILSVNGQNFDAYGNSVTIDYCTTNSVTINVPHMWVQGTGGVAQPPLQEVIYSWTLPSGWTTNGGLNTTVNSITIHPTQCAVSGTGMVSVKGNIIDRCGSAGLSNAATISLNGASNLFKGKYSNEI